MTSEGYTYRRASASPLWDAAKRALDQFNDRYLEAQKRFRGNGPDDVDADTALLDEFAFMKNGTAPSKWRTPFLDWMVSAFSMGDVPDPEAFRPKGPMIMEIIDGKRDIQDFLTALDEYRDALQAVVQAVAPEHFSYQGFQISNPDRLGDKQCRRVLEGVDYLVALFKKRGVQPMLHLGVTDVALVTQQTLERQGGGDNVNWLGLYFQGTQSISLSTRSVGLGIGRFMRWVDEVFLHEFGHYVHLNYLSREAREVWDASWGDVHQKQDELEQAFKSISLEERRKFFDILIDAAFDPSRAVKKFGPVAKVKFGVWLRVPLVGDPLITDKQFRLTKAGQYMAQFYNDQQQFMLDNYQLPNYVNGVPDKIEYDKQWVTVDKRFKSKLGLLWGGQWPIPAATVQALAESDPTMQKAVNEALNKLEIVSDYGRTNEKEDFAETFVAFMGAPEKLTPTAKARMQRTLWLSAFYNKPVMRLASKPPTKSQLDYAIHLLKQQGVEADLSQMSGVEVSTLISDLKAKRGKPVFYGNGQFSHWEPPGDSLLYRNFPRRG